LEGDRPADESEEIFGEPAHPLGFNNLYFPASIVFIGTGVAILLALIEKLYKSNSI